MSWIEKILPRTQSSEKSNVPEGIWTKCGSCDSVLYRSELEKLLEPNNRSVIVRNYALLESQLGGIGASEKTAKLIVKKTSKVH